MGLEQPSVFTKLVRGAGVALTLKIISQGVLYCSEILLARWMGTSAYGIYNYGISLGLLLGFIAGFGLPTVVLRFVSAYKIQEDWSHLKGILQGAWQQTLLIGIIVSFVSTGILLWINSNHDLGAYFIPLIVGVWTTPSVSLKNLQKESIRAFQKIILSYGPSLVLQPILLVVLASIWQGWQALTSTTALFLSLLAMLLSLALQWLVFQQNLDSNIRNAKPTYENTRWWQTALPLMLFSGAFMVLSQTDTLMIGVLLNAQKVGIYNAALKTSAWVNFILLAVNAISAPLIASLYAEGNRQSLQQLISTISRWMFYPALITGIGLISFSGPILQLFGPEFITAKWILIIFVLGELVNVGVGPVGYLMTMTGHQNQSAMVMGVSALMNVILNFIGIYFWGILGAAIATALTMVMWNIWLYVLVVQQLGVRPSILDAFRTES